jgi:protein ImuB
MDHRPEQMQAWLSATYYIAVDAINTGARSLKTLKSKKSPMDAPTPWAQGTAPTWLLAEPLKLAVVQQHPYYQGPLTLLAGPFDLPSPNLTLAIVAWLSAMWR